MLVFSIVAFHYCAINYFLKGSPSIASTQLVGDEEKAGHDGDQNDSVEKIFEYYVDSLAPLFSSNVTLSYLMQFQIASISSGFKDPFYSPPEHVNLV
jgi:hypothetical protein